MMRILTLGCVLLAAPFVWAQGPGGQGAQEDAQKILKKIAEEMQLIDKLLNQASKSGGGGGGSSSSSSGGASGSKSSGSKSSGSKAGGSKAGGDALDGLLEKSIEQSNSVVKRIDELLKLAKQRQQQQQQQQRQQQQNQQRNQQQQGQGRRDRRRPDRRMQQQMEMMRRQQQQQQQQQGKQQQKNKDNPDDPRAAQQRGKQEFGKDRKYRPGSKYEKALREGKWGELPKYLQVLHRAGGRPKLPAKYSRHREEFHRRADRGNKKRK